VSAILSAIPSIPSWATSHPHFEPNCLRPHKLKWKDIEYRTFLAKCSVAIVSQVQAHFLNTLRFTNAECLGVVYLFTVIGQCHCVSEIVCLRFSIKINITVLSQNI